MHRTNFTCLWLVTICGTLVVQVSFSRKITWILQDIWEYLRCEKSHLTRLWLHTKTLSERMEIIILFLRLSNMQTRHLYVCEIQFVDIDFVSVHPVEVSLKVKVDVPQMLSPFLISA